MLVDRRREMIPNAKIVYGDFGGYQFAPGPLVYENNQFRIQNKWNEINSYGSKSGKTNGSTYFTFIQIGKRLTGNSNFKESSGDITNTYPFSYNNYDDWGMPTEKVMQMFIGIGTNALPRSGSIVNGNTGKHYSRITTNISYVNQSNIGGYLFFPDHEVITGHSLSAFDSTTLAASNVTASELNNFIKQGCIFLPFTGAYDITSWYQGGTHIRIPHTHTSSNNYLYSGGLFCGENRVEVNDEIVNKEYNCCPIIVCRKIVPEGTFILYTDGSLSPYDTFNSGKTPVGVVLCNAYVSFVLHPTDSSKKTWSPNTSTTISNVTTTTYSSMAKTDYNGLANTNAIYAANKQGTAFDFARNAVYADGRTGYLPSCGEMEQIRLNETNINIALNLIGGTPLYFSSSNYWCSTQYNSSKAWAWGYSSSKWGYGAKNGGTYCRSVATV